MTHVLGASSYDIVTVNRLQMAGLPAYLVVPHEEALVLGATHVDPVSPSFLPSVDSSTIWDSATSKPMPLVYTTHTSPLVHDIVTQPPRYTSLETYFLGLDNDLRVVPIGKRGIVTVGSVIPNGSKRTNRHSSHKSMSCHRFFKLCINCPDHIL